MTKDRTFFIHVSVEQIKQLDEQNENREDKQNRSDLWNQLANAIDLRNAQDQVLWSIFGTFWAANAILLVALFPSGRFPKVPAVGIIISLVGMIMSLIWYGMQRRALGHLNRHEELITEIETRLGIDQKLATSARINDESYARNLGGGIAARWLMKISSIIVAGFWAIMLGFFLCLGYFIKCNFHGFY